MPRDGRLPAGVTPAMSAAYDILVDAGYPPERAAVYAVTSDRMFRRGETKRNAVDMAHHLAALRRAAGGDA